MLRKNKTLFKLLLNGAMLDDADGAQILDSIHTHPTLDLVDLIRNDLGAQSSLKIASLVKENRILKQYYFRDNQLHMDGIRLALKNLEENFVVTCFDISGNPEIPESAVERVEELLERNKEKEKEAFTKAMQLKSSSKAGWQRSKLMVVGEGRAGKTATVNSLLGKTFDPKWDSTIGIQQTEVVSQEDKWRPTKKTEKGDNALKFAARVAERLIRKGSFHELEEAVTQHKSTMSLDLDSAKGESKNGTTVHAEVKNPTNVEVVQATREGQENQVEQSRENRAGSSNAQIAVEESEGTAEFMKKYKHDFIVKAQTRRDAVSVSVWDYGGQKVFYTLHHLFLTNYGIYLLVFSIPQVLKSPEKSMEYLKFWINSIQLHAPNAPIMIAGTSLCDLEQKRGMERLNELFSSANVNRYNQAILNEETSQYFFCIDNKYDVGVKALRGTLRELIKSQEHVNFQVSIKWMHCLDKITELNRDWLPIGKVTEVAESCAITRASELSEMLHLFHELGVVIHFTKTQSLADVVTVRPQWLVDEISKVIRDPSIHKFDASVMASVGLEPDIKRLFEVGIASEDLIDYFWSRHSKEFLLDLMRSLLLLSDWDFDRTNSDVQNHYLIPSMISAAQDKTEVSGLKAVFDFSAFFLPDGLFERLVCLCVQHSAYLKGSKTPVLTQTHCTIWLGDKDVISLSRVKNTIQLNILRSAIAANVLTVIHSMFRKLKDETMGSRLKWGSFLQVQDKLVAYEDAKSARAKPWFQNSSTPKNLSTRLEQFGEL